MKTKYKQHIVVFDGTSAYIIPKEDLTKELEVLKDFDDIDEAEIYCETKNKEINGN